MFVSLVIICWAWATGIDNMKEKHPDYKGEDFLNWDDDKIHTEDKI
jgi:hypothetical protein